jgi:hypothetical protein
MDIKIIFPDNKEISFNPGITAAEAVKTWKKETLAYIIAVPVKVCLYCATAHLT